MGYTISYSEGRFRRLSSKYKHVCCLLKDNAATISKLVNYPLKTNYEDMYHVYIDAEQGVLVFAYEALISMGAASTDTVEFATVISFDDLKTLLSYDLTHWKNRVETWLNEKDMKRANSCKERVQEIETIMNTAESDWKNLIDL